MIEIRQLNKKRLLEYFNSAIFSTGADIPITLHRALSHTKNPRLDEEDIILLLAYQEDDMVGYLGILPDFILKNKESPVKFGWLSCFWVSQKVRGGGIGNKLISKSLELWQNQILSADYVLSTKKIYDRTNKFVNEPYTKKGIRLYVKSDLYNILPPKKEIYDKLKVLLKAMDFIANVALSIRLGLYRKELSHLQLEYIEEIDDEVNDFIIPKQDKQLFRRRKEELNWIIHNPWILSANKKSDLDKKYYFSSTVSSFNFYSLKIRNAENKLIAFMIFTKIDCSLKMPYLYHDDCLDTVIAVLNYHLIKWRIKTFTSFNTELAHRLQSSKTPAIFKKELQRNYLIASIFKDEVFNSNIEMQDGDADCCFT